MSLDDVFQAVEREFQRRKFAAGLAITFVDFLTAIGAIGRGLRNYQDFLGQYPRQLSDARGRTLNTLSVALPDGSTKSIRSFYDAVQRELRATHHRLDYPSAAPHATQAWPDYTDWIGALVCASAEDVAAFRGRVLNFVLATLPSHALDESALLREPPLFHVLLSSFHLGVERGEPTGAAFQGAVFAYLRADAPHLQVEVRKVRTGSRRVGGIGDIDAWDGDRLVITAEAKHSLFSANDVPEIAWFADQTTRHGAVGLVVAEEIDPAVCAYLRERGLTPLSRQQLIDLVALWDPLKQRIATQAFLYYASHVEQNAALTGRIHAFLRAHTTPADMRPRPAPTLET